MADTRAGVQLPPNSTGLVTGALPVRNPDDPSAAVWVPATVLVDANGHEIGGDLLQELRALNTTLSRLYDGAVCADLIEEA